MEDDKQKRLDEALKKAAPKFQKIQQGVQDRLNPIFRKAAQAYEDRLKEVEVEYSEAAGFYREWTGRTPPRFQPWLDWYYSTKDFPQQWALLENPAEAILEEEVEDAAEWMKLKIEEARQNRKLCLELIQGIVADYPETAQFVGDATMKVKSFPLANRFLNSWQVKREAALSDEDFLQAVKAEIDKLEGEVQAAYQSFPTDTSMEKADNTQREQFHLLKFKNLLQVRLLTSTFLPKNSPALPGETDWEEVEAICRKLLGNFGWLDEEGNYRFSRTEEIKVRAGTPIKALYNVLRGNITGIYPEEQFSSFFEQQFSFPYDSRSLQNPPSKGQPELEKEYRKLMK